MKKTTTTQPVLTDTIDKTPHDFLAEVDTGLIQISKTNDMFRDPRDLEQEGLKDLIDSIRSKGLLQPILLRGSGNGGFILVAGERRFRACQELGLNKIPAYIKEMSESEAFELQLTENLQRQDVHPMKEARAYKHLLENSGWSTAELALRFGKSETYVLQRLRLTSLLPEIAKDFAAGDLNLAQALVIARLEKKDQEELLDNCKNHDGNLASKRNYYQSAQELENYIMENITRELTAVPWDLDDAQLVPKAGACSACAKRSGAQGKLFTDIKDKDRCFDSACFKSKMSAGLLIKVKKLVEEKPDTIFLEDDGWGADKPDQKIINFLAGQKIKPMGSNAYTTINYGSYKKAINGFYINGQHAGRTHKVYVQGPETKALKAASNGEQKVTEEDIKESIERIKERTKRAAELDAEKVYTRVIEAAEKHDALKRGRVKYTPEDISLMAGLLFEFTNYEEHLKSFGLKELGWGEELKEAKKQVEALNRLTQYDCAEMARHVALHCREGFHLPQKAQTTMGLLIKAAAKSWGIPVDQFEKEQAEERAKREERAAQRIKELQAQIKTKKKGGAEK